jgi:hypothetical protein
MDLRRTTDDDTGDPRAANSAEDIGQRVAFQNRDRQGAPDHAALPGQRGPCRHLHVRQDLLQELASATGGLTIRQKVR